MIAPYLSVRGEPKAMLSRMARSTVKVTYLEVVGTNYWKHKILETKTNSFLQHA